MTPGTSLDSSPLPPSKNVSRSYFIKHSRKPYSRKEKAAILAYVIKTKSFNRLKSKALYTEMERNRVCFRTAESMRTHFLKTLVHELNTFEFVTDEMKLKLLGQQINSHTEARKEAGEEPVPSCSYFSPCGYNPIKRNKIVNSIASNDQISNTHSNVNETETVYKDKSSNVCNFVNKHSFQPYLMSEKEAMLRYIMKYKAYNRLKSIALFREMERKNICPKRSAESMKTHFLKTLIKELDSFAFISFEIKQKLLGLKVPLKEGNQFENKDTPLGETGSSLDEEIDNHEETDEMSENEEEITPLQEVILEESSGRTGPKDRLKSVPPKDMLIGENMYVEKELDKQKRFPGKTEKEPFRLDINKRVRKCNSKRRLYNINSDVFFNEEFEESIVGECMEKNNELNVDRRMSKDNDENRARLQDEENSEMDIDARMSEEDYENGMNQEDEENRINQEDEESRMNQEDEENRMNQEDEENRMNQEDEENRMNQDDEENRVSEHERNNELYIDERMCEGDNENRMSQQDKNIELQDESVAISQQNEESRICELDEQNNEMDVDRRTSEGNNENRISLPDKESRMSEQVDTIRIREEDWNKKGGKEEKILNNQKVKEYLSKKLVKSQSVHLKKKVSSTKCEKKFENVQPKDFKDSDRLSENEENPQAIINANVVTSFHSQKKKLLLSVSKPTTKENGSDASSSKGASNIGSFDPCSTKNKERAHNIQLAFFREKALNKGNPPSEIYTNPEKSVKTTKKKLLSPVDKSTYSKEKDSDSSSSEGVSRIYSLDLGDTKNKEKAHKIQRIKSNIYTKPAKYSKMTRRKVLSKFNQPACSKENETYSSSNEGASGTNSSSDSSDSFSDCKDKSHKVHQKEVKVNERKCQSKINTNPIKSYRSTRKKVVSDDSEKDSDSSDSEETNWIEDSTSDSFEPSSESFDSSDLDLASPPDTETILSKHSRSHFTRQEKKAILRYIIRKKAFNRTRSLALFREMERKNICPRRTCESMKNQFRRTLIKELDTFSFITEKLKKKFIK